MRFLSFWVMLLVSSAAFAQTDIYVRGAGKLFPVALPQLCLQSGDPSVAKEIPRIMQKDLDISGYFEVLDASAYLEAPGKCTGQEGFAYSDWSVIGAEGLVRGEVRASAGGVLVRMYLHDVPKQQVVIAKEYEGDLSYLPRMAHKFANEVMRYFTREPGIFGTQIAFSSKVGRFKEVFVVDMNGENVRQVTEDRGLALSPSWHPSGRSLIYTGYRNRVPDLFLVDLASRSLQQITRGAALEVSPRILRDGQSVVAARSDGRESSIVQMGMDGALLRRLTQNAGAIDVSPSFSPDEQRFAFCSNRGGGPQIYTMRTDGSELRRVSFVSSNYCTSPSWSPKGDRIAFVCRADAGFQLFSAALDGSDAIQLTSSGSSEDPDFSPDGRYIVYAASPGHGAIGGLAIMRSDGSSTRQLTTSRGGDSKPSWGPLF